MKVMLVVKLETYKDEAKRKKYYELDNSIWAKKHEGIKYTFLDGWGVQPGKVVYLHLYESMEEFSKIWSDIEIQTLLLNMRNLVKNCEVEIWRQTVAAPPNKDAHFGDEPIRGQ